MRELTEQEEKIFKSRHIECSGTKHHHGAYFMADVRSMDDTVIPATFEVKCFTCNQRHTIQTTDVRYLYK